MEQKAQSTVKKGQVQPEGQLGRPWVALPPRLGAAWRRREVVGCSPSPAGGAGQGTSAHDHRPLGSLIVLTS
jgi:hypothetical protein